MPIKIEHLSHVYQPGSPFQSDALQDIDFTIEDGELLALIGHLGSRAGGRRGYQPEGR